MKVLPNMYVACQLIVPFSKRATELNAASKFPDPPSVNPPTLYVICQSDIHTTKLIRVNTYPPTITPVGID